MRLRKWTSNSTHLQQLFDQEEGITSLDRTVKILGMVWEPQGDFIAVATKSVLRFLDEERNSKRSVLHTVARIFDPLGMIAPFTVQAKILFQELWKRDVSWDEELPLDIRAQWRRWRSELQELGSVKVPRWVELSAETTLVQLHIFCDASQKAYGACAYLRVEDNRHSTKTALVMAKSRVAPMKTLTLPRLELLGAVLGSRMASFLGTSLSKIRCNVETIFWTDSRITLHWIAGNPSQWKEFVKNRVTEIQRLSAKTKWRHCPGHCNPADYLTRGISLHTLKTDERWWHGPTWLLQEPTDWPTEDLEVRLNNVDEEKATCVQVCYVRTVHPILDLARYSSLLRILRTTAWILRFVRNCRNVATRIRTSISAEEIKDAELYWVKVVQQDSYGEELEQLCNQAPLDSRSKIMLLSPFLDSKGLMRVRSRIEFSDEEDEVKHPLILPPSHEFTEMVIRECHQRTLHGGIQDTLTELRQRFWVQRGRQIVKKVIGRCNACIRTRLKPASAPIAPLPGDRVRRSDPFEVVGIDFPGPLYTRTEGSSAKVYIALFSCAVTRALHLELVSGLSSEVFLLALRRFTSRRGLPAVIYTDNARTFKKASKDIASLERRCLTEGSKIIAPKHECSGSLL